MKITIYVKEEHLENLHKFLRDGTERPVEWHNLRPRQSIFRWYKVSISYDDFVELNELSE